MPVCSSVALRKESVDRNPFPYLLWQFGRASLSARRAWIEIGLSYFYIIKITVALRKESVDRNFTTRTRTPIGCVSLSARRAWIEIIGPLIFSVQPRVALRKESVDRNNRRLATVHNAEVALRKESVDRNPYVPLAKVRHCGRSPQGERG